MAVTGNKRKDQQLMQDAQAQQQRMAQQGQQAQQQASYTMNQRQDVSDGGKKNGNAYTGLAGVSQRTAQQTGNYQQGYRPGDTVTAAQNTLAQIRSQKPGEYKSQYGQQLNDILQQIQNPEKFKYEFNGDELFKYYADLYTQKGRQASMDSMGQAAALTGGYGNSYAQQVGNQAYQQYLLNLYDKGMDMRDRAYQQYQDQLANNKDVYGLLSQQDQIEYGRYRDALGDWENERNYWTQQAENERNFDYNQFLENRNYWTGLAQVENQQYNTEQERQEAIRQYEQNFAEEQRQYNESMAENQRQFNENLNWNQKSEEQKYASNYVLSILANGQMPSAELLAAAGISEGDARKLMAQLAAGGGGGGGGKKSTTTTTTPKNENNSLAYYQNLWNQNIQPQLEATAKRILSNVKPVKGYEGTKGTKFRTKK